LGNSIRETEEHVTEFSVFRFSKPNLSRIGRRSILVVPDKDNFVLDDTDDSAGKKWKGDKKAGSQQEDFQAQHDVFSCFSLLNVVVTFQ
jgi:hypothetical protein